MAAWLSALLLFLPQDPAERATDRATGRTYVRTPEPLTYADAERVARGMGGTLVSVGSIAEEIFLLDQFGPEERYWIGLEFPRTAWSDGTPLEYTHWASGMPSGATEKSFTVMNWGEPGAWGEAGYEAEESYRALVEFAPGVEPGVVPPLGAARRGKRGVLLVALQGLSEKELRNPRLPHLHGLFERGAWTLDAGADGSGDPLAGLGMVTWGVGSAKSGLSSAAPEKAARHSNENLLSRLERQYPEITTVALFDDASLSGILLDGRIDLRVPNASARRGGAEEPVRDALARPTPLCLLAAFTDVALRDEEASEASRAKEIAAIDKELGTLLEGLRARPSFAEEEWWIAVAGLAPPAPKKGKPALEGRARTAVPLVLVAPEIAPGEIRAEVSLADLVPSAMDFLAVEPRASAGFDGHVLRLGARPELGVNLLFNPGGEAQLTYETGAHPLTPGWRVVEPFRLARRTRDLAGPSGGGVNLFAGAGQTLARMEQTLDLGPLAAEIDRGALRFTLAGWLGSQKQSPATIDLLVEFLSEAGKVQESVHLGPLGLAERRELLGVANGVPASGLIERTQAGKVPRRARAARIVLLAEGPNGVQNTLADELSFLLTSE
jgi:hypothetical protein